MRGRGIVPERSAGDKGNGVAVHIGNIIRIIIVIGQVFVGIGHERRPANCR